QCVKVVTGILDHLGALPPEHHRGATEEPSRLAALRLPSVMGANHRQRRCAKVLDARPFPQELRAIVDLHLTGATEILEKGLDDGTGAAGQHRATENDDVLLAGTLQCFADLLRYSAHKVEIQPP